MEKQFIGCTVSVDCGEHGTYQGVVNCINSETLVLKKAFRNGVPHPENLATLKYVKCLCCISVSFIPVIIIVNPYSSN